MKMRTHFLSALALLAASACGEGDWESTGSVSEAILDGNGIYELVSVNSELCLDVAAARLEDAATVQQWTCNNTDAQRFALRSLGSNDYELRAVHSGKCLDVRAASTANGAVIQQYACNGTAAQRWKVIDLGSGQYQLRPQTADNLCLDVANVSREPGAPVQQYGCWEQARNQRWWLNKTSDGGTGGGGTGGGPTTGTPVQQHGALKVVGTALVDQYDRPVQLKGISSMWLNWQSKPYAENKEALRWMRDNWNVSVFRAAMGVEPQGAYLSDPNRALRQLETIVQNAVELGVYVIIDWHAHEAFKNTRAAQDFFYNMAAKWGDKPNVLYETFNEPLAVSWSSILKPYHEAVVGAIRAKDPDNVIILGTPNWSQDVDAAAGDPLRSSGNLMYTLHFYSCSHQAWLRDKASAALARGLPIFVTEWGGTHADGGLDGKICDGESQAWQDWMNARKISWAAWKLDGCQDSSCLLRPGAPENGNWDNWLQGHGWFVRDHLR